MILVIKSTIYHHKLRMVWSDTDRVGLTLTLHIFVNNCFDLLKGIVMNNVHHKTQLVLCLYLIIH